MSDTPAAPADVIRRSIGALYSCLLSGEPLSEQMVAARTDGLAALASLLAERDEASERADRYFVKYSRKDRDWQAAEAERDEARAALGQAVEELREIHVRLEAIAARSAALRLWEEGLR